MPKKRAILIVALVAVLGGTGAYLFSKSAEGDPESVRTANVGAARSATSTESLVAEITATIYQIDRLQLDPAIFNSPAFKALQDRTQTIPPEVPGRENPFAPLYSDAAPVTRSTRPQGTGGLLNSRPAGSPGASTTTSSR
jgi:hypothetical protein